MSHFRYKIIEGVVTVALGLACWFLIPEFPDRNTFLTKAQTAFVLKRVEDDRGDSVPDEITPRKMLHHMGDWKLWAFGEKPVCWSSPSEPYIMKITGVMFGCATLPAYMLAFFLPIILAGMNYSTSDVLLLVSCLTHLTTNLNLTTLLDFTSLCCCCTTRVHISFKAQNSHFPC